MPVLLGVFTLAMVHLCTVRSYQMLCFEGSAIALLGVLEAAGLRLLGPRPNSLDFEGLCFITS